MRISSGAILLLLTACGGGGSAPDAEGNGPRNDVAVEADARIECAIGGGELRRDCSLEEEGDMKGARLTVRHPDGGFRRLLVAADGSVTSADGAEPATVAEGGPGHVEVTVGRDRYRLPADTSAAR